MPPGTETMISPTQEFAKAYGDVLVEFKLQPGTTDALFDIGVADGSKLVNSSYNLPSVQSGWKANNAFFKAESNSVVVNQQVNIGLGNGKALDIFNDSILEHLVK